MKLKSLLSEIVFVCCIPFIILTTYVMTIDREDISNILTFILASIATLFVFFILLGAVMTIDENQVLLQHIEEILK